MWRPALRRRHLLGIAAVAIVTGVAVPVAAQDRSGARVSDGVLAHLSQGAAVRYYVSHPDRAPEDMRSLADGLRSTDVVDRPMTGRARVAAPTRPFNADDVGLPQNEESVSVCRQARRHVLGGTNDYRGLLSPVGNFTGWHYSNTGGRFLVNEGLLPAVDIKGVSVPSGGDPVDVFASGCDAYAASLAYLPTESFVSQVNGIAVYKSDPETLASCPGGEDPSCWPVRKAVAVSPNPPGAGFEPTPERPAVFFDKEWFDVGRSGAAGKVVWVVYSAFRMTGPGTDTLDYTVTLQAVRCDADLNRCTRPIVLSSAPDIQFGDVTVGPDGRVYVTWADIEGELPGEGGEPSQPQRFIIKSRVAEAGSTQFGPERIVQVIERPMPFGGRLHAEDFRVATIPRQEVVTVGGATRFFVTYDECTARVLDAICEEPQVKLTYSDDRGATWSTPVVVSADRHIPRFSREQPDNFFPAIAADRATGQLAMTWYTTRYDPAFHNRYDVDLVSVDPRTASVTGYTRVPGASNEPEADPVLGGLFIGDYFDVAAWRGRAYVHFNANYRKVPLLGEGLPVNQQDNFLVTRRTP